MAYDVMIASTMADKAKAELVAKRLRALKFKVRYDAKREHSTPTSRDLTDANKSGAVLVLWSKAACDTGSADSDWVHAIAHLARSRGGALVQAGLDATIPDDPFDKDERYKLVGMGPKRIPNGFYDLVDKLGADQGRSGLSDYLKIAAGDTAARAAWREAHPGDPIAQAGKKSPAKTGTASKKRAAAKPAEKPEAQASEAAAVPAATSNMADSETLTPKIKLNPPVSPSAMPYRRPDPASLRDEEKLEIGWTMIGPIIGGIVLMMLLAWVFRSDQVASQRVISQQGIANATLPAVPAACPPGEVPRSLIDIPPLRTGPIIDDTQDETPEAPEE